MTPTIHTAGGEILIWLAFIIFSMVAQAIKGAKKFKENRPQQDSPLGPDQEASPSAQRGPAPRPHLDPQRELEEFLRNLSGATEPPPAPQPTPVAKAAPAAETVRRATPTAPPALPHMASRHSKAKRAKRPSTAAPAAVATVVETPAAPRRPAPLKVSEIAKAEDQHYAIVDHSKEHESAIRDLRLDIGKTLANKKSLRKAILLKEILGPPIALREIAQHQMPR